MIIRKVTVRVLDTVVLLNLRTILSAIARRPVKWSWAGVLLQAPLILISYFWIRYDYYAPSIGVAIGVLGFAAVVMAVRTEHFTLVERAVWIIAGSMLLYVEINAIRTQDEEQSKRRTEATERFEATAKGLENVLAEQKTSTKKVTKDLEDSARIVQQRLLVRLEPVKSIAVDWFLSDYGPEVAKYVELNRADSNYTKEDGDHLLWAIFCSFRDGVSRAALRISLVKSQVLDFEAAANISEDGDCQPTTQLVTTSFDRSRRELRLDRDSFDEVDPKKRRAVYHLTAFEQALQTLQLSPPLTSSSFVSKSMVTFVVTVGKPANPREVAEHLLDQLPRFVGITIRPNLSRVKFEFGTSQSSNEEFATTQFFRRESKPLVTNNIANNFVRFIYRPMRIPKEFDSVGFMDLPVVEQKKPSE